MLTRVGRFNFYFLLACCTAVLSGCKTTEEKREAKEMTLLRIHREARANGSPAVVKVGFRSGFVASAEASPVLDERNLESAEIVEADTGFAIQLRFAQHGKLLLDQLTTEIRNRRLLIFCQWEEGRWLAAPVFKTRVQSGYLTFTPDASREEAIRIVRGLNNIVKQVKARGDSW